MKIRDIFEDVIPFKRREETDPIKKFHKEQNRKNMGPSGVTTFTPKQFPKNALRQYLETALWSSYDVDGEMPLNSNFTINDFSEEAVSKARVDLNKFWKMAGDLIANEDPEQIAHDFWLTRNGHGVGFWDRTYENDDDGTKGDRLTELSKKFGEIYPHVGDDGKIYFG